MYVHVCKVYTHFVRNITRLFLLTGFWDLDDLGKKDFKFPTGSTSTCSPDIPIRRYNEGEEGEVEGKRRWEIKGRVKMVEDGKEREGEES